MLLAVRCSMAELIAAFKSIGKSEKI